MPDTQTNDAPPAASQGESADGLSPVTASPIEESRDTTTEKTGENPVQPVESAPIVQPNTTKDGKPIWDGKPENLEKVGANEIERGKAMERYLTKRTQEIADIQKKAQAYEQLSKDPGFLNYQQQLQAQRAMAFNQTPQAPLVSQQDWDDARMDPDPNKFAGLVNRVVENRIIQAEQYVGAKLNEISQKQSVLEHTQEIEDFAKVTPDFWELYDSGILAPLVKEMVDTKQGSLMEAYNKGIEIRDKFRQEAVRNSNANVMRKKAAVSALPSSSQESAIIYAPDKNAADRIAFDNALLGKKVDVRVKK